MATEEVFIITPKRKDENPSIHQALHDKIFSSAEKAREYLYSKFAVYEDYYPDKFDVYRVIIIEIEKCS